VKQHSLYTKKTSGRAIAHDKKNYALHTIQVKPTIGKSVEQNEGDIADQNMPEPGNKTIQRVCNTCDKKELQTKPLEENIAPLIQKKPGNIEDELVIRQKPLLQLQPEIEEQPVQTKPWIQTQNDKNNASSTINVESQLSQTTGKGDRLTDDTRSFMEDRFGANFSNVKIHTGHESVQMANNLNAQAFTYGNDIYFNSEKYSTETSTGKQLLAHELTHVLQQKANKNLNKKPLIQREPDETAQKAPCYKDGNQPSPSAREPELHPTYESWLRSFTNMTTFSAKDNVLTKSYSSYFNVLGAKASRYGAKGSDETSPVVPYKGNYRPGEEFIDHPTNEWVKRCLPDNLVATAYQLPSDCADIALILRHVWLAAHHRTEIYRTGKDKVWTIGWQEDVTEKSMPKFQNQTFDLIQEFYAPENIDEMVQPYSTTGANGKENRLTDFDALQHLLHPGDILVWDHRQIVRNKKGKITGDKSTGGHTQTITNIDRSGDKINSIEVLQGNLPISPTAATEILESQKAKDTSSESDAGKALRKLPGRRIEAYHAISYKNITYPINEKVIWGREEYEDNYTILEAAGPPKAAQRPGVSGEKGTKSILDWRQSIKSSEKNTIAGVEESILSETRSLVEAGSPYKPTVSDMDILGRLLGEKLSNLYQNKLDPSLLKSYTDMVLYFALDSYKKEEVFQLFMPFNFAFANAAVAVKK
jgi:hypothetical protein